MIAIRIMLLTTILLLFSYALSYAEKMSVYNKDYSKREYIIQDRKYIYDNKYNRIGVIQGNKVYDNNYNRKYNLKDYNGRYDGDGRGTRSSERGKGGR